LVSKLKEKIKSRIQHDLDSVDTNILQEIWLLWSTVLEEMSLVLSRTGIDLRALEETLLSTACKGHVTNGYAQRITNTNAIL
jgi:hypothetical protein